jgi:tetratricopeptide (TPR) repeat protein
MVQQDIRRYRGRFIAEGQAALRDRHYEPALDAFENALVLDPRSRNIRTSLEQSRKAVQLSQMRNALDDVKQGMAQHDYVKLSSATITSAALMPDNKQARIQLIQTPSLLAQLGTSEIAFFNSSRGQEIGQIHEAYHVCVASEDIQGARFHVEQAKTIAPGSPVTTHLISDLAASEKKLFNAAMDQAAIAFSKGDYRKAYLRYTKAEQVFPDNADLKRSLGEFHDFYLRKQKFAPFDRLYQEQLYNLAALHYVKGEIPECLVSLRELLRRNVIHEQGNFLRTFLQDKKVIQEDSNYEEPTIQQASLK